LSAAPLIQGVLVLALTLPPLALLLAGAALLVTRRVPERYLHALLSATFLAGLALSGGALLALPLVEGHRVVVDLGSLLSVRGYHLDFVFVADAPGLAYLALDFLLGGVIGRVSARYLHREDGYQKFFVLLLLFVSGIAVVATARGLDLLFVGWEAVGLCSVLLISFFHHRVAPVEGALRALFTYRVTDIALLAAIVVAHHELGSADPSAIGAAIRPDRGGALLAVALLVVMGAVGKGGLVPLTGWLPRALEGPTPSSAIFYGALSLHASPFLLLRCAPLFEHAPEARALIGVLGGVTALHAWTTGRVQTDVKSAIAYAAIAQVGLIWVEIALGWHTLALVHLLGNAIWRTRQIVRSPSVLQEHLAFARQFGVADAARWSLERRLPRPVARWWFRFLHDRWGFDRVVDAGIGAVRAALLGLARLDGWIVGRIDPAARGRGDRR
jgi:NADH-quinone oxidoreductase subunit L